MTNEQEIQKPVETMPQSERDEANKHIINVSGDTLAEACKKYPADHAAAVTWLYLYAKDNGLGYKELMKELGVNPTTIYRVFIGRYVNNDSGELINLDNFCAKIITMRRLVEQRAHFTTLPFQETSVWHKINRVCTEAHAMHAIALIYGEPQIGKSMALIEHARRQAPGSVIYVLVPAGGGLQSMMKAIAAACHISVRTDFDQLRQRVTKFMSIGKRMLILDEVHEVFLSYQNKSMTKCISVLRQLQETTRIAMVLCGTNAFRDQVESGEFTQALKQLTMRSIWRLQLPDHPSVDDIRTIYTFYKLPAPPDELKSKIKLITDNNGLGMFVKFMMRASAQANARKQRFNWGHFSDIVTIAANTSRKSSNNSPANN